MFLKVDDSVSVNDIDLSLYIPRDVDETGITVASLERFSTYTSEKDGKYANFHVIHKLRNCLKEVRPVLANLDGCRYQTGNINV